MGNEVAKPALYPLHRTKIIHLIRHGQGHHNVAAEKDVLSHFSENYFDASLTSLGWQQAHALQSHLKQHSKLGVQLVVTSPLMRTMQTAVAVFGEKKTVNDDNNNNNYYYNNNNNDTNVNDNNNNYSEEGGNNDNNGDNNDNKNDKNDDNNNNNHILLMKANTGNSEMENIYSLNDCPPFVAAELCREQKGAFPCDRRRKISEYKEMFPGINFSQIESEDDIYWSPILRESGDEMKNRSKQFIKWLLNREEEVIAVVSHSNFLNSLLSLFGEDCSTLVQNDLKKTFKNCEMRSVVLVDKCATEPSNQITQFFVKNFLNNSNFEEKRESNDVTIEEKQ